MTLDTERRIESLATAVAKPPPPTAEQRGYRLFQTMDGLRARHGTAVRAKHRMLRAAAAFAGAALLFAALYSVIHLLE